MDLIFINKHFSAFLRRLRSVFIKNVKGSDFNTSEGYSQTLATTLESLRFQEEEFANFIHVKQKEIDSKDPGILKSKMQEHLDKIAAQTHKHFSEFKNLYFGLPQANIDREMRLNDSKKHQT